MRQPLLFQNNSQSHKKETSTVSTGMDLDTFLICMGIAVGGFIIFCLVIRYCCLKDVFRSEDHWRLRGRGRIHFNRVSHEQGDYLSTPIASDDEGPHETIRSTAVVDHRPSADAESQYYSDRAASLQ